MFEAMTYYDSVLQRRRFKRRYIWGFYGLLGGTVLGFLLSALI
jgi:hypothetical protein